MKDSILGMPNALIRVYINFRFRWADDRNIRFEVYFLYDVLIKTSFNTFVLKYLSDKPFVVVVLVFYGPSTHFRSFRAWAVNLTRLFLGKPLRKFTST